MVLSVLRTGLLCLAFAGMSTLAQGIAPSGNATPRDAPVGNPPDATEQQAPPATSAEPMNLTPSDTDRLSALAECDNRPLDEQQACRDSVTEQYAPTGEDEPSDSTSGAGQ